MKHSASAVTILSLVVLACWVFCLSCSSSKNKNSGTPNGGNGDGSDGSGNGGSGGNGGGGGGSNNCSAELQCGDLCCQAGEICFQNTCMARSTCATDDDCQNDSYCDTDGQCTSYDTGTRGASNPNCTRLVVAGLFQPSLQCEWTGPPAGDLYPNHIQVLATPMVADFDFDSDPTTIHPSIVFNTYDGLDGDSGSQGAYYGVLRIIDGLTCETQFSLGPLDGDTCGQTNPSSRCLNGSNPVAIGDINGDGRPEIVAHTKNGGVIAFVYNKDSKQFEKLWDGHDASSPSVPKVLGIGATQWGGPSIIDLDNDGKPEILSGGLVYGSDGLLLDQSLGLTGVYNARFPVAADLDGDGLVEMVNGDKLWKFDPILKKWVAQSYSGTQAGYTAVADFGTYVGADPSKYDRTKLDGIPEIVVVSGGKVQIQNLTGNTVFGQINLPNSTGGGPPTIGDFDGDGLPEIAASGSDSMTVFDPDCQGSPKSGTCNTLRTDGILWSQASQDHSSNITGSSLFDFDGDGKVEVIYADEVFVRVYNGSDGAVLFSQWRSSCTWNDFPIVADTDGDYAAELVVSSNENCSTRPADTFGNSQTYPLSPHNNGVSCSVAADCQSRRCSGGFCWNVLDPLFAGLPCKTADDCNTGATCDTGLCRCTDDSQCGDSGSGFVCAPPPTGTPGNGGQQE